MYLKVKPLGTPTSPELFGGMKTLYKEFSNTGWLLTAKWGKLLFFLILDHPQCKWCHRAQGCKLLWISLKLKFNILCSPWMINGTIFWPIRQKLWNPSSSSRVIEYMEICRIYADPPWRDVLVNLLLWFHCVAINRPATVCVMFVQHSYLLLSERRVSIFKLALLYPTVLSAWCTSHFFSHPVHNSSHLCCSPPLSIYFWCLSCPELSCLKNLKSLIDLWKAVTKLRAS